MATAREMYNRAGWTIGFALILYYINYREYPGPAAALAGAIALIGLAFVGFGYVIHWLNTVGQARVREQILDLAGLHDGERILEVGCGTGALSIAAAKRLNAGKIIAIGDTVTNEIARENARREGVVDKVRFESGPVDKLSYPNANFGIVLSSRSIDALGTMAEKERTIAEMVRVLKPGGRLVLHSIGEAELYRTVLKGLSLPDPEVTSTQLPLKLGGTILSLVKPA